MKRVTFYGHEKNETTAKLAQINLAVHGLEGKIRSCNEGITYYKDSSTLTAMPHVKSGRLRALAVTSARRSDVMPDLPTVAKSGMPRFVAVGGAGVFAPACVPKALIDQLNREINAVLAVPNTRERLLASGSETAAPSATEFARFADGETVRWAAVGEMRHRTLASSRRERQRT